MKFIIFAAALIAGGSAFAQTSETSSGTANPSIPTTAQEVVTEFHWGGADLEPFANKWPWTGGMGGNVQDPSLGVEWHDKGPVSQTLRTLGSDIVSHVTSAHYAIVGRLKYTNVSAGSYLEMLSYFAPEKEGGPEGWYYSRTLADAGPMAKLEGTDEGRDFLLPFDSIGAKTKLVRLVLNLHLGGPGGVELSDVKLVQYPDAPTPPAAQTPAGTSNPASSATASNNLGPQDSNAQEGQIIAECTWANSTALESGNLIHKDGEPDILKVEHSPGTLWDMDSPKITAAHYAVTGEIRYENVPDGYLEMHNNFAPVEAGGLPGNYISRTLADQGLMGRLKGTSD